MRGGEKVLGHVKERAWKNGKAVEQRWQEKQPYAKQKRRVEDPAV